MNILSKRRNYYYFKRGMYVMRDLENRAFIYKKNYSFFFIRGMYYIRYGISSIKGIKDIDKNKKLC